MAFIKKISDYITEHYDLTKENITIVFPNKRAALQLRNELAKTITTNFWVPQILSIQQAMEEWSGLQLIDNIEVIFEIIKENPNFFGYAAQMAKDFDEIDQYNVDAKRLFEHLNDEKEIEEWRIGEKSIVSNYLNFFKSLLSHYTNLRKTLQKNGQGYYGMITRTIASFDDATLQKCTQGRKIIFAGFNALTKTEEDIIVRMVKNGNAVILWDLDKYYFDDERQEAGYFAREFFKKHPEIEKNFISDNFKTQQKNINIISVSGNAVQTSALQIALSKDKKGKEDKKTVVVLADETLLIPVLSSIPEKCGSIQVTMGYPFNKTIVYHFVEQLFKYQQTLSNNENKLYLWTFIRLCGCEFIKLIFKELAYNKLNSTLMQLAKHSNYYFKKSDLKDFVNNEQLVDFLNLITKKWNDAIDCVESLKAILKLSANLLDEDSNFVKNQISVAGRIANRLELLLRKYANDLNIINLQSLYAQVAAQMSINYQKDTTEGLQIMGLLETRNLDFDVIHFLSVNEGILPKTKSNNSLIPFNLRKEYGLPTYTYQQNVYAYHFYRLLQNAKEINLYYNNLADQSGMGEPSRFIRQLEYEYLKYNDKVKLEHWQYKSPSINKNQSKIEIKKTDEILNKITRLSPSAIQNYNACTLKYYWKNVERIEDKTPEEEMQENTLGSIIHDTLDLFYKKFNKNEVISLELFNQMLAKHFDECYREALKKNGFANGLPETGFNCLSTTKIESMRQRFIKYEREFLEKGNQLSIIDTETQLTKEIDYQGHTILLNGTADRIDQVNDEIRIIDYKTGKMKSDDVKIGKNATAIRSMKDKALQLMMYKYLYLQNNKDVSADKVKPAIIAFKKISNGQFDLKIDNSELNNSFEDVCARYIEDFLAELFNKEIPFTQCEKIDACRICDFKSICKRIPKDYY